MPAARTFRLASGDDIGGLVRFLSAGPYPWRVEVSAWKPRRSLAMNRLYHFWVDTLRSFLLDHYGQEWTHEDLHEALKVRLLKPRVVELDGHPVVITASTASLTVSEFADLLTDFERYAERTWELVLPQPADLYGEALGR